MTLYLGDDDAPPFPWPPPTDHVPAALRPDIFADGYVPVRAPDHDSTPGVYVEAIMGGTRCHVAWRECRRPEIERVTRPLPRVLNVDLTHTLGRYALARALGAFWALPRGDGGQIPDGLARWSSHLLACGAWRRVAGMTALAGVVRRRRPYHYEHIAGTVGLLGNVTDADVLAASYALLGPDSIALPWPETRPDLSMEVTR